MWNRYKRNKEVVVLNNVRIVDPAEHLDRIGHVIISHGVIKDYGTGPFPGNTTENDIKVIDCKGHVLIPGILDIHVHLRDPGDESIEDIKNGTKTAASCGITTVVCQPNTKPAIDEKYMVDYLKYKSLSEAAVNISTYAAVSKNLAGRVMTDIAILRDAGAIGFTDDGMPIMDSLIMARAMHIAKSCDALIAQHAEDTTLSNNGCINLGKISEQLGVPGASNASEAALIARDIELCRASRGARYHVLHVSTKESVELVRRAKADGLNVTCEVTPHHFTLDENAVLTHNTMAKMNPPLRTAEDIEAIITGLQDNTINCIATDHAPHACSRKENLSLEEAAFGIVGLETFVPLTLALYHRKLLTLTQTIAKITYDAAELLKLKRGRIAKGYPADLTLIDIEREFTITRNNRITKAVNTPFYDHKLKGKAIGTIVEGHIVYSDGSVELCDKNELQSKYINESAVYR